MSTLREALQEYLGLRRNLGYKMHDEGRLLPRFVAFLEERQAQHITAQWALQCPRRCKSEPPCRLNFEPGVEAGLVMAGCG